MTSKVKANYLQIEPYKTQLQLLSDQDSSYLKNCIDSAKFLESLGSLLPHPWIQEVKIVKAGLLSVEAADKFQRLKSCKENSLKETLHRIHTVASLIAFPAMLCLSLSSLGKEDSPALNTLHSHLQTPLSYALPLFHLLTVTKNVYSLYLQREVMQTTMTNFLQKSVFACNGIKTACKASSLALCVFAISNYEFSKAVIKCVSSTNQLVLAPLSMWNTFKERTMKEKQDNEHIEAILGETLERLMALQEPSSKGSSNN